MHDCFEVWTEDGDTMRLLGRIDLDRDDPACHPTMIERGTPIHIGGDGECGFGPANPDSYDLAEVVCVYQAARYGYERRAGWLLTPQPLLIVTVTSTCGGEE